MVKEFNEQSRFQELIEKGMLPGAALRKVEEESIIVKKKEEESRKEADAEAEKRLKEKLRLEKERLKGKPYSEKEEEKEKLSLSEVLEKDVTEYGGTFAGEAIGLIGGLVGVQFLGEAIEKSVTSNTSTSSLSVIIGWFMNNLPKVVIYTAMKRYVGYVELNEGLENGVVVGIHKAMPASIVLDTVRRLTGTKILNMNQQKLPGLQRLINER